MKLVVIEILIKYQKAINQNIKKHTTFILRKQNSVFSRQKNLSDKMSDKS